MSFYPAPSPTDDQKAEVQRFLESEFPPPDTIMVAPSDQLTVFHLPKNQLEIINDFFQAFPGDIKSKLRAFGVIKKLKGSSDCSVIVDAEGVRIQDWRKFPPFVQRGYLNRNPQKLDARTPSR